MNRKISDLIMDRTVEQAKSYNDIYNTIDFVRKNGTADDTRVYISKILKKFDNGEA